MGAVALGRLPRTPSNFAERIMQLTVADPAVDTIDLVLAAWSEARPTQHPSSAMDEARAEALVAQLSMRLEDGQIPLWDDRS